MFAQQILAAYLSQRYRSCLGGNVGALASILEPFASTAMDRNRNTFVQDGKK